jgi:lysozyme
MPGEQFTEITEERGRELLMRDLQFRAGWIPTHIHVPLNDNRFSAVLSLVFNMGTAPLVGHLGTYLNENRFQDAADEFPRWVYADHRKLPGLVRRREAERELFLMPLDNPDA